MSMKDAMGKAFEKAGEKLPASSKKRKKNGVLPKRVLISALSK
jgi:hypothetical protein